MLPIPCAFSSIYAASLNTCKPGVSVINFGMRTINQRCTLPILCYLFRPRFVDIIKRVINGNIVYEVMKWILLFSR